MGRAIALFKQSAASRVIERWSQRHPLSAFLLVFFGLPVTLVGSVAACTAAVMLPVSLLLGWI